MEAKNSLLSQFIKIQNMQHQLDNLSRDIRKLSTEKRSLAQKLPLMIKGLDLKQ